jgi:alpha-galactosidase/6-phospho-beta-glucosidase family protein
MRYGRRIYDMAEQRERVVTWDKLARGWQASPGQHRLTELPPGPEDEGIVVAELMQAVIEDRRELFVVNVSNERLLVPNLPADCAVEVPAVVTGEGVRGIPIQPMPTGLAGILGRHAKVQRLTMQAALSGDRLLLDQAMATDPLLEATLEPDQIRRLTEDMLQVNRPYLSVGNTARLYRNGSPS